MIAAIAVINSWKRQADDDVFYRQVLGVRDYYRGRFRGGKAKSCSWCACGFAAFGFVAGDYWLWRDTKDVERIADLAQSTFWYVLPSLPMFLVLPAMLRVGVGFWTSIGASCALTMVLYTATAWVLARFGINL